MVSRLHEKTVSSAHGGKLVIWGQGHTGVQSLSWIMLCSIWRQRVCADRVTCTSIEDSSSPTVSVDAFGFVQLNKMDNAAEILLLKTSAWSATGREEAKLPNVHDCVET